MEHFKSYLSMIARRHPLRYIGQALTQKFEIPRYESSKSTSKERRGCKQTIYLICYYFYSNLYVTLNVNITMYQAISHWIRKKMYKMCNTDCFNLKPYNRKSAAWVEEKKKRRKRKKHNLNPHFDENSIYRRGRGGSGTKVRIIQISVPCILNEIKMHSFVILH